MRTPSARRRAVGVVSLVATLAFIAAACAPPPAAPVTNFTFKATSVTAIDQTEYIPVVNRYDEPYLVNVHFRVKIGVANSAVANVVSTRSASPEPEVCKVANQSGFGSCDSGTQTYTLNGAQQGAVTFSNVARPDVANLLAGDSVEVVGVWTWAMEEDLIGTLTPGSLANILQSALNSTLAQGSVPSDPNLLAQLIIDNLGSAIGVAGSGLLNALSGFLLGAGDDLLSSRMYVFVGSSGALADIIDAAAIDATGFNLNVQTVGIPNVAGISIRSTDATTFTNQSFVGAGADHRYDFATTTP